MEILSQLGDLFLAAVPTVIIVFLFYFFLRWSFFKPIERVLAERHKRAEGARQEAEQSRAAVQEKLRAYNDSLKKARSEMFVEQEGIRRRVLDERQTKVSTARVAAQKALHEAKQVIAEEVKSARAELEQSSGDMATEIADAILAGGPAGPGASRPGGAR
ncbi:MAG: ATP synthase F0 subunit B [Acidobacteriia bacterium]|nr:ATP synthase F0 subunit B [Terriglobia bacterium]